GLFWGNFDTVTATRSFFDTSKPSFLSNNTFDITSGGPVYVPHLYDGRNKTFYFFSYSGLRFRSGNRIYTSVPTDAFRRGDFSAICSTYDASGRCTDPAGTQLVDPTTGQPFSGNIIPDDRISSVAKAFQDLVYPEPNPQATGPSASTQISTKNPASPTNLHDFNFGKQVNLGIQGIDNPGNDPAIGGLPDFSFGGIRPFEGVGSWPNSIRDAQNTYELIDNLSRYTGRHAFKMGIDVRRYQDNNENKPPELRGSYSFDDQLSGLAYANFLLGFPTTAKRTTPRPNAYVRSWHSALYFQDDLKINQRVTFNYGLRYEYQTPWVEKFNRLFGFDPTTGDVVTAGTSIPTDLVPAVASTLPIVPASQARYPTRSLLKTDRNNWDPRLGLAIRPLGDATTVVRIGFGVYNQVWPGNLALNATGEPWTATQTFFIQQNVPSVSFPDPFTTSGQL